MFSSFPPVGVHLAGQGNTVQPVVRPMLQEMPPEITDHILSFTPDSVRACRAVSKAFQHTGEGSLKELAESVVAISSDSSLYGLIQNRFASFSLHLQSHPSSSCLWFHLSLSEGIASLGVPKDPNKILSLQEMDQCNTNLLNNLWKIWGLLRQQIMRTGPQPAGIPGDDAPTQQIRSWMLQDANQPALQRITHLNLDHRALKCVPLEIRLCTALQTLNLNNNMITSLPAGAFQGLTSLRSLGLYNNRISSLGVGVFQGLSSLQTLALNDNRLVSLSDGVFRGLTALQNVRLDNNWLVSLPEGVFRGLTSLRGLDLANNRLVSLPEGVFTGLTSLQWISLFGNRLVSLPERIFYGLTTLQNLSISDNQLTSLPVGVFMGLTALQDLFLSNNRLASLPEGVFQGLTVLETLCLYNNQLAALPEGVFQELTALQKLVIHGNLRLLVAHNLANVNNLSFRKSMSRFFNYRCRSPFAEFYQLAARGGAPDTMRASFLALPDHIKNAIYRFICVEAGRRITRDIRWGVNHAFDDMGIFYGAMKRYVMESFTQLNSGQQNAVYGHVYHHLPRSWRELDPADINPSSTKCLPHEHFVTN